MLLFYQPVKNLMSVSPARWLLPTLLRICSTFFPDLSRQKMCRPRVSLPGPCEFTCFDRFLATTGTVVVRFGMCLE
jgi:hypothetical protein